MEATRQDAVSEAATVLNMLRARFESTTAHIPDAHRWVGRWCLGLEVSAVTRTLPAAG
jgi:hypothetical protein